MKEIIKYLRKINSFTQQEVADKLNISRQSYIKYENGEIVPNNKVIKNLSTIYKVTETFIRNNKIPEIQSNSIYKEQDDYSIQVAESQIAYKTKTQTKNDEYLEGYFDGTYIRIINLDGNKNFQKGQKFKIYIENEEEDLQKRKTAFENFNSIIKKGKKCILKTTEDPYYKEALYNVREEKYEFIN